MIQVPLHLGLVVSDRVASIDCLFNLVQPLAPYVLVEQCQVCEVVLRQGVLVEGEVDVQTLVFDQICKLGLDDLQLILLEEEVIFLDLYDVLYN